MCQIKLLIICLLYISFPRKKSIMKRDYAGTFDVSCGMFSNVISLVLRNSDTDPENVSLIRRSVSDGQKTCRSKGVSLISI